MSGAHSRSGYYRHISYSLWRQSFQLRHASYTCTSDRQRVMYIWFQTIMLGFIYSSQGKFRMHATEPGKYLVNAYIAVLIIKSGQNLTSSTFYRISMFQVLPWRFNFCFCDHQNLIQLTGKYFHTNVDNSRCWICMMSSAFDAHFIITINCNASGWIFCAIRGGKMYTYNSTARHVLLTCIRIWRGLSEVYALRWWL